MPRAESQHLDMMRHPERWPHPLLPLKHRSRTEPDCNMGLLGFMFEDTRKGEAAPRVYIGCMYFAARAAELPVEDYPDLESVVRAGWEVN